MASYALHGLVVDSVIPIHATVVDVPGPADLEIIVERVDIRPRPGSATVLSHDFGEGRTLSVTDEPEGFLFTYGRPIRALISHDLARLAVWCDDDADWGLAAVLVEGWLMAFVLQMRGACVLHASAVVLDGRAYAFVGDSGMGKSTLATLLCLNGGWLLTDDVLCVETGPPVGLTGTTATRLRQAASSMVDGSSSARRETADGRLSVTVRTQPFVDRAPLAALVVPWPSREATTASATLLKPAVALHALMQYPRVYDWHLPMQLRRHFTMVADLVAEVPVADVVAPWGPPWPDSVASDVTECLLGLSAG